jgi:hypothetical protein
MAQPERPQAAEGAPDRGVPLRVYLRRLIWACMLPLVAVAVYLGFAGVAQIRQAEDEAGARLVLQVSDAVEQSLRARIATMVVLAQSPFLEQGASLQEFHRLAQGFRQGHGSDLVLADADGRMRLHSGQPFGSELPPLPRPSGRAAAPLAMTTGQPSVGDSFIGPLVKVRLVAVAVPVPAGAPSAQALLSVVPAQRFQELLDRVPLPEGWTLSLIDGQREVFARRPQPAPSASASASASAAASGIAPSPVGGARFVHALSLAPQAGRARAARTGRDARAARGRTYRRARRGA